MPVSDPNPQSILPTDDSNARANEPVQGHEVSAPGFDLSASGLTLLVLGSEAALTLIAALGAYWFSFHDPRIPLNQVFWGGWESTTWVGFLLAIPLFGFIIGLLPKVPAIQKSMASMEQSLMPMFRDMRSWQAIFISCCAGLGEEIFFRWFLLGGLSLYLPWWWACLISSIVFGLGHYLSNAYFIITTFVGVLLALVYLYFGLGAAIACHATYDFLAILYLRKKYRAAAGLI